MAMASPSWQHFLASLTNPSTDTQAKCTVLVELRDSIDFFTHGQDYNNFAPQIIPVLLKLFDTPLAFISTASEQRVRHTALEILHRLPLTPQDAVKDHVAGIVETLLEILRTDNEDNGILCIKTIMDLLRVHNKALSSYVAPFLNLILDIFNNLEKLVAAAFQEPSSQSFPSSAPSSQQYLQSQGSAPGGPSSTDTGFDQSVPRQLSKAMESFKVIAECPIAVVSVFQVHGPLMAESVTTFCPVIIKTLLLQVPAQETARAEYLAQGRLLIGVFQGIKNKDGFGDFFVAQVKMMSFLAFLLRQYGGSFADFLPKLPDTVVRMLQDCPRDRPGARKELIVAFRHIISYSFRRIFLKSIDQLQDERVLLGDGLMVQHTTRPLAFSILADLIHHLRDQLTKEQIRFIIQVYTKNLLEDYPGGSFSAMSTKLLLNMSECITKIDPKEDGRHFLMVILNSIGDKFKAMNYQFENSVKQFKQYTPPKIDYVPKSYLADSKDRPDWDEIEILSATPIAATGNAERASDPVNDNRFLFKNLLNGLKTVFYQLRTCNPPLPKDHAEPMGTSQFNLNDFTYGYSPEEVKILVKLFHEGIRAFRYFGVHKDDDDSRSWEVASKAEEELLEVFATVFHHLDPATFYEVFQPEMEHFYHLILEYRPLSHVAKFLLACEATSPAFANMLIEFLMTKLPILGIADKKQSEVLLLLFRLFFLAVTLFPAHNEAVVEGHIVKIITRSLELATTAEEPMNYYSLLRNLFRSIGGGRFDQCYTNILPLLEMLLETLNNLLMIARRPQDRDLFVELTLTVPTRLSNLLPYLRHLMKPLGVALRAGPDLVAQGLRTLELCVDNLTADYLDPLMAPALDDLMSALWDHLKPSPYNHFHSHTTLRILGKLAGRNRHFLTGQQTLSYKSYTDDEPSIDLKLIGTVRDRPFPVSLGLSTCIGILEQTSSLTINSTDLQYAYRLVASKVKLLIGNDSLPDDLGQLVRLQAEDAYNRKFDVGPDVLNRPDQDLSVSKMDEQRKELTKLLCACIHAIAVDELKVEAREFVFGLVRYVAVMDSGRKIAFSKHNGKAFESDGGEGPSFLHPYVLCDAIADALGSVSIQVREIAIEVIHHLKETAETILGDGKKPDQFPVFKYLARLFAHRCHKEELFTKTAGTLGLETLALKLGFSDEWLREWQLTFIRALLYVLKDLPYNVPSLCRTKSLEVLVAIVSRCNGGMKPDEMHNNKSNLYAVSSLLMYELAHIDAHVRQGARQSFATMAKVMGCSVEDILKPITPRLLQTVFMKPLRTLPFDKQIGYIESITYVFQAGQDLVPIDENLLRLLDGLFVIADAEDTGFAPKPIEHRTAENITKLRVACIRLLTEIHQGLKGAPSEQNQQRRDNIEVRLLQFLNRPGMSAAVMDAAFDSLQIVHDPVHQLPKALMANCRQSILAVMAGTQQPTADFPDRLSRFLRLFSSCFRHDNRQDNPLTLVPLLKHIKTFETRYVPAQKSSIMPMERNPIIRLIANMLDTIYLLPQGAVQYMEPVIQQILTLESALRRTQVSPFREPLMHLLERFSEEAWMMLGPRIKVFSHGRFFAQLVGHPLGERLRKTVASKLNMLVEALRLNTDDRWAVLINAIHLIWAISQYPETRAVVEKDGAVRRALIEAGKVLESHLKQNGFGFSLHLAAFQASEQVTEILIAIMEADPTNIENAFEVVEAMTIEELRSSHELPRFIYKQWICSPSLELRKKLISKALAIYANQHGSPAKMKAFLLRHVVNPILAQDVMNNWDSLFSGRKGTDLVDKGLLDMIVTRLWRAEAFSSDTEHNQLDENAARVEVLQLTAFLIKYHSSLIEYHSSVVQDVRREIVRFAWSLITSDEIVVKYGAYVVLAFYAATFEASPEMCARVYSALLKAQQNENRVIAAQGLELLSGVLERLPVVVEYPRRAISDEYHNGPQLITSFQFLVRHVELFYGARTTFAAAIIPSLTKIGPIPGSQPENRRQVLNLIRTIWSWQRQSLDEAVKEGKDLESQYIAPYPLRHGLVQYLITFVATLGNAYPTLPFRNQAGPLTGVIYPDIPRLAIEILTDILRDGWLDIELRQFLAASNERSVQVVWKNLTLDRLTVEQTPAYTARLVYSLEVVKVVLNVRSDEWIIQNLDILKTVLEQSLKEDIPEVQESLHCPTGELKSIIGRILNAIPQGGTTAEDEDVTMEDDAPHQFVTYLHSLATEGFEKGHLSSAIGILGALCEWRKTEATRHLGPLLKVFAGGLVKNHVVHYGKRQDKTDKPKEREKEKEKSKDKEPDVEGEKKDEGKDEKDKDEEPKEKDEVDLAPSAAELNTQIGLIIKCLEILSSRATELGDLRRNFLQSVAVLVERSQSNEICLKILDMCEKWVFEMDDVLPTMKERVAILTKMLTFEQRTDPSLLARYLDLVIRIYDDPKIQRSELTVRLEQAFLVGTRSTNVETRNKFMAIFDKHISRTASSRLSYLLASQDWRSLQDSFWLQQVIQLLFGSIEVHAPAQLHPSDLTMMAPSLVLSTHMKDSRLRTVDVDDKLAELISSVRAFQATVGSVKVRDIIEPLGHLQHLDPELAYAVWVAIFPLFWSAYPKEGRQTLEKALVGLLTKDDHHRQMDKRPNCIQAILEGIARVRPRMRFPPQIARYLAHTFDAWYTAAHMLEDNLIEPVVDTPRVWETTSDALLDLYSSLHEDDLFYGLWRRRCVYVETNAALSYEQVGMWEKAQQMYDSAQLKARTGALPFSQAEYTLWEDHWIICAQKLQQWEVLAEFAKHENLNDLYLEATWRNTEAWNSPDQREQLDSIIKAVSDAPTPRRLYFQCFMTLMKYHLKQASSHDVTRTGDEAMQLAIRKWHQLPRRITNAHVPLLQTFQSLVELMDANVIVGNLGQTTVQTLEQQAIELKHQLTTWRDRLPNFWDDINVWQDLVTWRQHIFHLINSVYLGLLPAGGSTTSNHYRGYHETAWIINRFAHVARKHHLTDVCVSQLSRIYTLPNIEIQEAFLKLREQAKCHYQNAAELTSGLDVINNTNLHYFGNAQKAEFHALKGMFLDKLGLKAEASDAFSNALSFDIKLPKAWAEWGRYHDGLFKDEPFNPEHASSAINCYLEAASLYKNSRSRHLLSRVLWLLSVDGPDKKLEMTFRNFHGEHPFWYWVSFIPQLLGSLLRPQVQVARGLLMKIAKEYPQALYFLLRTARDDFHMLRRQHQQPGQQPGPAGAAGGPESEKQAWDHLEDILALIKKTFPLLVLSIESLIDQVSKHFKSSPDEDAYRLIVALLNDSLSYVSRNPNLYSQAVKLPPSTEANISRFAQSILPVHIRASFEAEFVTTKPTMHECIHRLRSWRGRFEQRLDARESPISLELLSAHLSEFCFQKFEHVEVPGQYLFPSENNSNFVRIHRFLPDVDLVRNPGFCHRRLRIRGHDGSLHTFAIQHPASRHSRREERTLQLFRVLNEILVRRRESRRRNLQFDLPVIVPLTGIIRLIGDDPSATSFMTIYEDFCRRNKIDRDQPVLFNIEQLASVMPKTAPELVNALRTETMLAIQEKFVPHTVALHYFQATFPAFESFWLFRRRFSYQLAALSFMCFALQLSQRTPQKVIVSRSSGSVWGTELVSSIAASKPVLHNPEPVPFRLTPNMQTIMGPVATEGIFAPSIMAIARTLTERDGELDRTLAIFMRDEVVYWYTQSRAAGSSANGPGSTPTAGQIDVVQLRDAVLQNCDFILNRAVSLAQPPQNGVLPANQTVVDMVARAVDPSRLSLNEPLWMCYL